MEVERIEFTLEDILVIHHDWIVRLYTQGRKTEAEIVAILSEQRLIVTVDQVEECIREWQLEPFPTIPETRGVEQPLIQPSEANYYNRRPEASQSVAAQSQSQSQSPTVEFLPQSLVSSSTINNTALSSTPYTDPSGHERYRDRPLPPLPIAVRPSFTTRRSPQHSSYVRIERKCIHGNDLNDCTAIGDHLRNLNNGGPSSLSRYSDTEEFHEKIAVGIFGTCGWVGSMLAPLPAPEAAAPLRSPVQVPSPQEQQEGLQSSSTEEEDPEEKIELKYVRARDMTTSARRQKKATTIRLRLSKEKHRIKENGEALCQEKEPKEDRKRKRAETSSEESNDAGKMREAES